MLIMPPRHPRRSPSEAAERLPIDCPGLPERMPRCVLTPHRGIGYTKDNSKEGAIIMRLPRSGALWIECHVYYNGRVYWRTVCVPMDRPIFRVEDSRGIGSFADHKFDRRLNGCVVAR
jgi:hypothetical protein